MKGTIQNKHLNT